MTRTPTTTWRTRVLGAAFVVTAAGCTLMPFMQWSDLIRPCEQDKDCTEGYYCSEQVCLPGYPEQPDASLLFIPDGGDVPDGGGPPGS